MTSRITALAGTELRVLLRNRTLAVSALVTPLALGLFWAYAVGRSPFPTAGAIVVALQLAVALGMGIYVAATITLVARRHTKVLKRLRTTSLSDAGVLVALVAPVVVTGLAQVVVFAVVDVFAGIPRPVAVAPLLLAVVGGVALCVLAALATTVVTPSPERAQITTLPLTFILLGAGIALITLPTDGAWRALVAIPGAAIGDLIRLAFTGEGWTAALPALAALVVWSVVFGFLAGRRFRWDPRV